MNAKQSLLNKIKDGTFALCTDEEIARKLRLGKREAAVVKTYLKELCREGELLCDSYSRYGTVEQFGAVVGTVSGNERGFAFFVPNDSTLPDLFLPHRSLRGALHSDTVLAFPVGGRSGDEGEVFAILSRGISELVGTFHSERHGGYLYPDEKRFTADVYVPVPKTKGCKNGMKAVVKITSYGDNAVTGEITEILGESGDFLVEELALIRSHHLREEFPDEVLKEAANQAKRPVDDSLVGRTDFRDELIITVDGEDTRDIDDAISVKKEKNGYLLGVHIADVSHYVKKGSALDNEAFKRGTSAYFPDRVLPMLPPALSNDICSLNEGVDRLTLSCIMKISRGGAVLSKKVVPSVIRSRHRMTYTKITGIANGDKDLIAEYPDLVDFVSVAMELTGILKRAREKRGGIALDVKETKILYEDGKISIPEYERSLSHEMIEQFMVLANESVATLMTEREMPFIYRVHEKPSPEKASDFKQLLEEAGVKANFVPDEVKPMDYQALLKSLADSPFYSLVNNVMLRSMMKAAYSPDNVGHFGLASDCYCHFTSPIRRYPDLCIHRIIKDSLKDGETARTRYQSTVRNAATQSTMREWDAELAERDVDSLYVVAYMKEKVGEVYDAVVSGITTYGVFAQLKNTVEGMIPIESLPDDCYEYYENKYLLYGTRNSFRLGEELCVKVAGVDWGTRRVYFEYLGKRRQK